MKMLTREDILKNAAPAALEHVIYFLIREKEIVYVGKAQNVHARIAEHSKDKVFDSHFYIQCHPDELNNTEAEYIVRFNPVLNVNLPPNDFYKSIKIIRRLTEKGAWEVKRFIAENSITPVYRDYYKLKDFL